jgi:hypothetical protein
MRIVEDILGELRRGYGVDRDSEDKKGNHDQECMKMVEDTSQEGKEDKFL